MDILEKCLNEIIEVANEKKAHSVTSFHVADVSSITDYTLIIGATNIIHCKSLVEILEQRIALFSADDVADLFIPKRRSGKADSGWVILDMNSVVIHVVLEETRAHYQLDSVFESIASAVYY